MTLWVVYTDKSLVVLQLVSYSTSLFVIMANELQPKIPQPPILQKDMPFVDWVPTVHFRGMHMVLPQ